MASWSICKRRAAALGVLGCVAGLAGCFAFGSRDHDLDRTPIVNAGAGATILMPNQQAPVYHPGGQSYGPPGGHLSHQGQPAPAGAAGAMAPAPAPPGAWPVSGSGSGSSSGSGSGWGSQGAQQGAVQGPAAGAAAPGAVTFIGGAETNEVEHLHYNEEPSWFKYAALPFALVAAPFKFAAEKLAGEPERGPEVPRATTPMPSGPAPAPIQEAEGTAPAPSPPRAVGRDYESLRLAELERQLAPGSAAVPLGAARAGAAPPAPSIADELASLRARRASASAAPPQAGAAPAPRAALRPEGLSSGAPLAAPAADGRVDRNADGRPDQWLERRGSALVRELRDDDFDGRAELAISYDPETGEVRSVEEDHNSDAIPDSWTDYRGGRPLSQRRDTDFDGRVDSWIRYSDGEVSQIERDSNADGSPDRSAFYSRGRLLHEEIDQNHDGRSDVTLRYDDDQRLATREEDSDHDGTIDVISHYEGGRLVRRELATEAQALGDAPRS